MRNTITVLAVVVTLLVSGAMAVATVPEASAGNDDSHEGDESEFIITDMEAPAAGTVGEASGTGTVGETFVVNVTITNVGPEGTDPVEVELTRGGEEDGENRVNETRDVHLERDQTKTISVNLSTDDLEQGRYDVQVSTPDDSHGTSVELIDPDEIETSPVCVDHEENTATFRVTNDNDHDVYVSYHVNGTDDAGRLFILSDYEQHVTVPTDENGDVNVTFYYRGADEHDFETNVTLETVASNPERPCSELEKDWDEEDVSLTADCWDPVDNLAQYTVTNDHDEAITFRVSGSSSPFNVTVPANSEKSFTMGTADDGRGLAHLYGENGVESDYHFIDTERANTDARCDLGEPNEGDAYQVDLDVGEVIENLGADEESFYNSDGSLIQARNFHESGNATHSYETPDHDRTARAAVANGTLRYDAISFDGETGRATVNVSLSADADESVTLTFAVYELPDGTFEYQRDRADEQALLDHVTVTLEPGDSRTLTVDTDD